MKLQKTTINSLLSAGKNHSSFVIIVLGSLITFASNILFETFFDSIEYGEYSIFITYLLYVYSFGFLGLEQVLVRITEVSSTSKIVVSKYLFVLLLGVGFLFSGFSSYFFKEYFFETEASFFEISVITITVLFSQLYYNLYRLKSEFVLSQLFATSWKFPLAVLILIFFVSQEGTFQAVFDFFFYFSTILMLFFFLKISSFFSFKKTSKKKEIYSFWIYFLLAIGSVTLITFFDRFFIKREFGNEALGTYFYLANLFLFPFGVFQNYIGFKQLILFKENYKWAFFLEQLKKGFLFSIALGVVIVLGCYILDVFGLLQVHFYKNVPLILLFLSLGVIKVCYSLASAAVGAIISVESFKKINLFTIIITFTLYGIFYSFFKTSVEVVALFISLLWLFRFLIYVYYLKKE